MLPLDSPKMAEPFATFQAAYEGFNLHSLISLLLFLVFYYSHPSAREVASQL